MSSKNNTWPGRWAADLPWWPVIQTSPTNCCHPVAPPPSPGSRRQGWPQGRGDTAHCPHPCSPAWGVPPRAPLQGSVAGTRLSGLDWVRQHPRVLLALLVGAGGCSVLSSARQQQTPGSVPSPATVPRIRNSHLDPQPRPSENPLRAEAPAALGDPEAIAAPTSSPGLGQAGSCTQSQSAARQLSLPAGLTRAAMPRLIRFSRAGEGGRGASGQAHGEGCCGAEGTH